MERQYTIKEDVVIRGVGLHTGATVCCTLKAAPENSGVQFVRLDLEGHPVIPADADLVTDTSRGSTLSKGDARVHTVEHLMAALYGLQIDNVLVELDGPEIPILDGSSRQIVEALEKAGREQQQAERKYFVVRQNMRFYDPQTKTEIIAIPSDSYELAVSIDFDSKVLVAQSASFDNFDQFRDEISAARTFVFLHEVEYLYKNNLIQGGDLDNAIVFVEQPLSEEKQKELGALFNKPEVKVNGSHTLNNTELAYPNEPARHKLLDLMGDLALAGVPIKGKIIATRPGHKANVSFAKMIKQQMKDEKSGKVMPFVDLTKKPLYDINQIAEFLPHRYPFLLVDKIIEMSETHVVGLKNVTMNEPFFMGHFPGNPVMPGVIQIEAMAQVGGILAMNSVDDYKQYTPYFIKIESVKFKQKVLPGDTLIFILNLLSPIRRGICHMEGKAYVDGKVVMEAEMMAQLIKNEA